MIQNHLIHEYTIPLYVYIILLGHSYLADAGVVVYHVDAASVNSLRAVIVNAFK